MLLHEYAKTGSKHGVVVHDQDAKGVVSLRGPVRGRLHGEVLESPER
jgi:hypothetical protein